jgi:hypothetical protein
MTEEAGEGRNDPNIVCTYEYKKKKQEIQSRRKSPSVVTDLDSGGRGLGDKRCRWPLEAENGPQPIACWEIAMSVLQGLSS